jgi:hypothetical protein
MMKTFLTVLVTAVLTWLTFSLVYGVRIGIERLWLVSAIKVPGRMAIEEIQTEMNQGQYDLAKTNLQIFMDTWQRFNHGPDSFGGLGIGDIMVRLSTGGANHVASPETGGAANASQAIRSETNRTSPAAGTRP